jgi:Family of unknown function (DUF6459)
VSVAVAIRPAAAPTHFVRPAVRIVPAPRAEPPTDEERRWAGWEAPAATAPTLPFDLISPASTDRRASWQADEAGPAEPATGPAVAQPATGAAVAQSTGSGDTDDAARRGNVELARRVAHRFLSVCLEVLGGYRPVAHLRPLCSAQHYTAIAAHLAPAAPALPRGPLRAPSARPPARPVRPASPLAVNPSLGPGGGSSTRGKVHVRRVVTCVPCDGVTEVAVVLGQRDQVWAMAIRLERREQRWLCAYLRML